MVERYGKGNRLDFLRAAMRAMATEERADRLRGLQARMHAQIGRIYSPDQVNELVRAMRRAQRR